MNDPNTLIIATRQSPLALWQANYVKAELRRHHPRLTVRLLTQLTEGDLTQHKALARIGGKNLFVKELQHRLLDQTADIAVHSVKDLSCTPHPLLSLEAICERADPRDVFLSKKFNRFIDLPQKAVIGTSSPRRECQLKAPRPDLNFKLLRGNVETRLQKLADGEFDAIVLAAAGLIRLGLSFEITDYFSCDTILPAMGQGAIGIECRRNDDRIKSLLQPLNHSQSYDCVMAERAVNAHLLGDCFTPLAAFAHIQDHTLVLQALVGSCATTQILRAQATAPRHQAVALGTEVAERLLQQGANDLLKPRHE